MVCVHLLPSLGLPNLVFVDKRCHFFVIGMISTLIGYVYLISILYPVWDKMKIFDLIIVD